MLNGARRQELVECLHCPGLVLVDLLRRWQYEDMKFEAEQARHELPFNDGGHLQAAAFRASLGHCIDGAHDLHVIAEMSGELPCSAEVFSNRLMSARTAA